MNEMMMDAPYRPAALDQAQQGVLGKPLDRIDGPAKVTGAALYAYEGTPDGVAYGAIVGAPVGNGRVRGVDATAAEALPGVIAGATVTAIALVSYTAMAGVVGAGGLGDLAIRFGYQRFQTDVMVVTVVLLLILVQILQMIGDRLVTAVSHR